MNWVPLVQFPLQQDLSGLHTLLQQQQLPHHFTEEPQSQVLWVPKDTAIIDAVSHLVQQYQQNPKVQPQPSVPPTAKPAPLNLPAFKQAPVTWVLVVCCLLGYGLHFFPSLLVHFLFAPLTQHPFTPAALVAYWQASGEYWRIFTPAFIHFSLLHITFNGLWMLDLGRKLEAFLGARLFSLLFVVLALAGNLGQFAFQPEFPFGGASSAVYGFVGFISAVQFMHAKPPVFLPKGLLVFLWGFLLLGSTGLFDALIGPLANAGHWSGAFTGVVCGALFAWPKRR